MHCTLLIPDLLPPREFGAEPYAGLHLPALDLMLARGHIATHAALEFEQWMCDRFGVERQQDLPLAALLLQADGGNPEDHYWFCADPVELKVDRNRLIIARHVDDFTAAETAELTAALNHHFAADGIVFCAPAAWRWYLRAARAPRLVTTPLASAVNRSVKHHLPQGADALAWHRVMNEAQMILHAHPVTAARETRGAQSANSVWLYGGGTLAVPSQQPYTATWSGEVVTRALAGAAGVAHAVLPANGADWLAGASSGRHLIVIDALAAALRAASTAHWRDAIDTLDKNWLRPLLDALRAQKISRISLVACNQESLLETSLARANLRRFWRRVRPLAQYVRHV